MKSFFNTIAAGVIALVLTFVVAGLLDVPFGHALEAWMGDKMLMWRYDLGKRAGPAHKPDPALLFVAIDQASASDLGRWPFPRAIHGQFLQALAQENPKVVAWDAFFTEKTAPGLPADPATPPAVSAATDPDLVLQPDDEALVEAAKLTPRMVSAATGDFNSGSRLRGNESLPTRLLRNIVGNEENLLTYPFAVVPFPELRRVSYFGFAEADSMDLLRNVPLVVKIGTQVFPSLDLEILMQYWDVDPDHVVVDLGHEISLTSANGVETRIPINDAGAFLVNYRARAQDFPTMSYSAMGKGLTDKTNNRSSQERTDLLPIKDKIVMIGVTLSGTDNGATPIDFYSPGVAVHLNVLNNILQHDYLHELSAGIWMPLYALFLFGVGAAMLRVGILPMIPLGLLAMVLLADAAFATLWFGNELTPVLMPELGVVLLAGIVPARRFFGEEREKIRIKNVLRANLSDKVMNKMLEDPDNVKLGGMKQEITILFCDIRNFTRYCDDRDPQEVMDALNDYMEEMTQVVFKHEGTVDKYIGDCLMAFWNAPQPQADHAERAVACAMEMREALARFEMKGDTKRDAFECGIGIHTGEALVGNMGSSLKRNYTAMGSTVNLAARLESLTKQLNEHIVISREVYEQLPRDFPLVDRGDVAVPGFAKSVHVYAVVTDEDKISAVRCGYPPARYEDTPATTTTQPLWRLAPLDGDSSEKSLSQNSVILSLSKDPFRPSEKGNRTDPSPSSG